MTIGYRLAASLGAAAAGIAALVAPTPVDGAPVDNVRSLEETYANANAALLRGDSGAWNSMVPMDRDFVLFSPFGGKPSRFADYTPERLERMSRFFKNGTFKQEIVQSFVSDDMIVLATIERCNVEVGGLPAQDWALRVTSVFKRQGDRWVLAHRHADPLVNEVSLAESARLARGERAVAGN